mgnify:CR=1 FL=1
MLTEHRLSNGMRIWHSGSEGDSPRPLVLLLHERYGPVPYSLESTERLANEGFVTCVYDMFHRYDGDRKALEDATDRCDPTDNEALEDLDSVIAYMRSLDYVDGSKIGIAGFCASGRTPLVYASARDDLAAAVVFHGGIYPRDYAGTLAGQETTDSMIPRISSPVLGVFGEHDSLVPLENVIRFRNELRSAGKPYQLRVIGDVPHAWLNYTTDAYRAEQARESWELMVSFFRANFAEEWDSRIHTAIVADAGIAFPFLD